MAGIGQAQFPSPHQQTNPSNNTTPTPNDKERELNKVPIWIVVQGGETREVLETSYVFGGAFVAAGGETREVLETSYVFGGAFVAAGGETREVLETSRLKATYLWLRVAREVLETSYVFRGVFVAGTNGKVI